MLKLRSGDIAILGIDAENVRRLKEKRPIRVMMNDLCAKGQKAPRMIFIAYGDTLEEVARDIEEQTGLKLPTIAYPDPDAPKH